MFYTLRHGDKVVSFDDKQDAEHSLLFWLVSLDEGEEMTFSENGIITETFWIENDEVWNCGGERGSIEAESKAERRRGA